MRTIFISQHLRRGYLSSSYTASQVTRHYTGADHWNLRGYCAANMPAAAEGNGTMKGEVPKKPLNVVLTTLPTTIFSLMTNLAVQHQSVNLGQGFPDDEGPQSMKVSLCSMFLVSDLFPHLSRMPLSLIRDVCRI